MLIQISSLFHQKFRPSFLAPLLSVQCPSRPDSHTKIIFFSLSLSSLLFLTHSLLILFEWLKLFWYQNVHQCMYILMNTQCLKEENRQPDNFILTLTYICKSCYFFHFLSTPVLSFGESGFVYFMGTTSSVYPSIHDLVYN